MSFSLTGTDSLGCNASVATTIYKDPVLVTITSQFPSICYGTGDYLTGHGATIYQWSPGNFFGNPIYFAPDSSTTYTVFATDYLGCHDSETFYLPVTQLADAAFTDSISGGVVFFQNTSQNATNYLWDFGDGNFSFSANPQHAFVSSGSYTITLIATGPCNSDTIIQTIIVTGVYNNTRGIPDGMMISPNPATDYCDIKITTSSILNSILLIKDITGKKLYRLTLTEKNIRMNLNEFSPGIYFAELIQNGKSFREKLVKE